MQEITVALGSLRALVDMAKVAVDARDDAKIKQALAEMNMKLFDVTSAALSSVEKAAALQAELMEAQDQVRQLKHAAEERDSCTLTEIRPGAYAYVSKATEGRQYHHPPYLCQPCYDQKLKSLLQYIPARQGVDAAWRCPMVPEHSIDHPGTRIPIEYRV